MRRDLTDELPAKYCFSTCPPLAGLFIFCQQSTETLQGTPDLLIDHTIQSCGSRGLFDVLVSNIKFSFLEFHKFFITSQPGISY